MGRNQVGARMWAALAFCLAVITVSGCTAAPPADEDGSSPHQDEGGLHDDLLRTDRILQFGDCTIQSALIAAPSVIVAGEIPEGFAPVYGDDAGATALIGFSGTSCANATSQDSPAAHAEFRFYAFVEPPTELQNASVDDYLVLFFVTTSDASTAETYEAWGHWVENRNVDVESEDVGTWSVGTIVSAHGSEAWEIRTAVDPSNDQCYENKHVRSFAEGPSEINGYVDITSGPSCAWLGTAKATLPDVPASDPMDIVVWASLNGILTGQGRHVVESTSVVQEYTVFT